MTEDQNVYAEEIAAVDLPEDGDTNDPDQDFDWDNDKLGSMADFADEAEPELEDE